MLWLYLVFNVDVPINLFSIYLSMPTLACLVLLRTVVHRLCDSLPTILYNRLRANFYCFRVCSQKASLAELKAQLDEERDQRREEREKAAADLKVAVHKAQSDAQEELKQLSDAATRREREQQEVVNKLQV